MSAPYRSAASTGSGPSASRSASVPRSAYVITKYGRPSGSSPMSCTRTTRSESARRRILASSSNRARTSSRCAQLSASTLTATGASSTSSWASQTVANQPLPIRRTTR